MPCEQYRERHIFMRGPDIHVGKHHASYYYARKLCGIRHSNQDKHLRKVSKYMGPP